MSKFSFGENWQSFSKNALNDLRVNQARLDFNTLTAGVEFLGKKFLDIGFGQGLALFIAQEKGAQVYGIDLDPLATKALHCTQKWFNQSTIPDHQIVSVLDDEWAHQKKSTGGFDIVHAWGSLHHTGSMWKAIETAADLTKPNGILIMAIYTNHWSSPIWKWIKQCYNLCGPTCKMMIFYLLYPLLYLATWLSLKHSPSKIPRGMDFKHDVLDWLGGYPYEYASDKSIEQFLSAKGFNVMRHLNPLVPTGNHQWVFVKTA